MQPSPPHYSVVAKPDTQTRFSWVSLQCDVTGTVDRVDRVTQFTELKVRARLWFLKVRPHLESVAELAA